MSITGIRLHHIGVVVPSIEKASPWWCDIWGFQPVSPIVHDPIQKVRVQLFQMPDAFCIELIEPVDQNSPVTRFLTKHGGGLYHPCFEVDDLDAAIAAHREASAFPAGPPAPAAAFGGRRVVFLLTPQAMLTELVEAPSSSRDDRKRHIQEPSQGSRAV